MGDFRSWFVMPVVSPAIAPGFIARSIVPLQARRSGCE
jgi:hypothetical protein